MISEELGLRVEAVWIVGLTGMSIFYSVESMTRRSRQGMRAVPSSSDGAFWISMASYSLYNSVIAYLLHERADEGTRSLALFVVAIGLHFVVNDFSLREHHKDRYRRVGRWLLVAAIVVGAGVGAVTALHEVVLVTAVAFIGGGVILNVFKEELPREAESRLSSFLLGAVCYTVLLLAL